MRISDWSSDVCSSDLRRFQRRQCVEFLYSLGDRLSIRVGRPFANQVVTGSARKLHEIVQTKATLKQGRQLPSTGFVRPVHHTWQSIMREGRPGNWELELRLGGVPQFPLPRDHQGGAEAGGGE